jgi:hypothetical protein
MSDSAATNDSTTNMPTDTASDVRSPYKKNATRTGTATRSIRMPQLVGIYKGDICNTAISATNMATIAISCEFLLMVVESKKTIKKVWVINQY